MNIDSLSREEISEICDMLVAKMAEHIAGEFTAMIQVKKLRELVDREAPETMRLRAELNSLIIDKDIIEAELKKSRENVLEEVGGMIKAAVLVEREACKSIAHWYVQDQDSVNQTAVNIYNEISGRK